MKKAKEGQIINLNEVKIFNLGSGNDKKIKNKFSTNISGKK